MLVTLALYILTGKLSNESEVIKSHSWELLDARMAVKNMEMNYPDLDSPYVNKLYSRMEEDNRWGSGIYGGFDNLEKLCYQAFNALFAVAFKILTINSLRPLAPATRLSLYLKNFMPCTKVYSFSRSSAS